jgi:hypothetical protein
MLRLCCGVNEVVACSSQLPLESGVAVVVTVPVTPENVIAPVGLRAALLAGFVVSTTAVKVTLVPCPKITLVGLATSVVVVGYTALTVTGLDVELA